MINLNERVKVEFPKNLRKLDFEETYFRRFIVILIDSSVIDANFT